MNQHHHVPNNPAFLILVTAYHLAKSQHYLSLPPTTNLGIIPLVIPFPQIKLDKERDDKEIHVY